MGNRYRFRLNVSSGSPTLQETFGTSASDAATFGDASSRTYIGGVFTAGSSYTLVAIEWYGRKITSGGTPGTLTCTIRATTAGVTNTTILATASATMDPSAVGTSDGWNRFLFSGYALTSGTVYSMAMQSSSVNAAEYYIWRSGSFDGTKAIDNSTADVSWSTSLNRQANLRTYI